MQIKMSLAEYNAIRIPDRYPAIETAKKIRFPAGTGYADRLDMTLTPYLEEPISCIRKRGIHWLIVIAPTQSAKTTLLQVIIADTIDQNPCNVMYIMPTDKTSKRGFKDKILNLIKASPDLYKHALLPISENLTLTHATLDNMVIYAAKANSLADLSSLTAPIVILDEVRLMPLTLGEESNAIELGEDRMTTFLEDGRGQGAMVSTPSTEGDLLHTQLSRRNTIIYFLYTECTACGRMQRLDFFKNMFTAGVAHKECYCVFCEAKFDDSHMKRKMNKRIRYGVEGLDGAKYEDMPKLTYNERVVFWYTSMNSPFRSFTTIYNKYMDTKDNASRYLNFLQCWLAEFKKKEVSKLSDKILESKKTDLSRGVVPDWCKVLTIGVDTQAYEFFYVVRAWGSENRTHIVDFGRIESLYTEPDENVHGIFSRFFEYKIYYSETGKKWTCGLWAIDTGGNRTSQVYSATEGLDKCVRTKGRKIDDDFQYNSTLNLYLINSKTWLEQTDNDCSKPYWTLCRGITDEFKKQYLNIRKVEEYNKRGEDVSYWKSVGRTDYRFADVYNYVCLKIPMDTGSTFFNELNNPEWSYNPIGIINSMYEELVAENEITDKNIVDAVMAQRKIKRLTKLAPPPETDEIRKARAEYLQEDYLKNSRAGEFRI